MQIKLKVCGMREYQNIVDLLGLKPDYIGHIFYPKSPRFFGNNTSVEIPKTTKKIGVFVNESEEIILQIATQHHLDFAQLHGNEPVELAQSLKSKGLGVIKVLSVLDEMPLEAIRKFEQSVDFFLFDTKTPDFGGSGLKFDWQILKQYDATVPFFLSGGIAIEDIELIKKMNLKKLHAIDVNSKFEVSAGIKDIKKIEALKESL